MNFYFCETCGKRLTDTDVAEGAARDKKLKGVFCSACAVGVTTMDTLPLSEEKARQLLKAGEGQPATGMASDGDRNPSARPAKRRTTGKLPLRVPNSDRHRPGSGRISGRPASSGPGMWVAGGGGAAIVVVLLIFLFSGGEKQNRGVKRKNKPGKPSAAETEHGRAHADVGRQGLRENAAAMKAGLSATAIGRPDETAVTKPDDPDRNDFARAVARPDVTDAPEGAEAHNQELADQEETASKDRPGAKDKQPANAKTGKETQQGPDPFEILKLRREAYGQLDRVAGLLVKGDAKEAVAFAEEKQQVWGEHPDDEHRKYASAFAVAVSLGRALQARETVIRTAIRERIGRELVVLLKRGRQRGKLLKVDDARLTLESQSIINGKVVKTYITQLDWSKLASRFVDGFAKKWSPQPPTQVLLDILRRVGPGSKASPNEADRGSSLLEQAKGNALVPYLRWRIECARMGGLSVKCREEWKALKAVLAGKPAPKQARELLKGRYAGFGEAYGETEFYKQNETAIEKDLERLRLASITNFVVNGDFESGKKAPWGSGSRQNSSDVEERPDAKPGNRYWLRGSRCGVHQTVRVEPGVTYVLTAEVRELKGNGHLFGLQARNPEDKAGRGGGKRVPKGESDFAISRRFTATGTEAIVGISFEQSSACVDSLRLVRVEDASVE